MADAGFTIDAALKPAVTWRGRDANGTRVVLKLLPNDCLRNGRLHPAVRLRLTRLREVPVARFANVIGVARLDVGAVLISEFVRGRPLDALPMPEREKHLPDCRRLVAALHRHGLVHGAIGPGNFIVSRRAPLKLIDPSPLLYDDPLLDDIALSRLDPKTDRSTEDVEPPPRRHRPTLAAAAGLSLAATAAGAWWAWHVAASGAGQ